MSSDFRIFGSELSPLFGEGALVLPLGLAAQWIPTLACRAGRVQKYAKLPLVPLVVTPDGVGIQDLDADHRDFEARHPDPSIVPADATLAFLSACSRSTATSGATSGCFTIAGYYRPDAWATAERIAPQMMDAKGTLAVSPSARAPPLLRRNDVRPPGFRRFQRGSRRPTIGRRSSVCWNC